MFTQEKKIWGPTEAYTDAWGSLPTNDIFSTVAYDTFYAFNIDGLHAFNVETGESLWDFYGDPAGFDFPGYSTLPFENNMFYTIADGKVIASTGDSHGVPEYRGAKLYAVDAYSGDEIWSIKGYYQTTMPVADGYLVAFNAYDTEIYTFGKGPTATTISAPENIQALGDKVLIKGTVTDQSAGTKQDELAARFPNGVPAIADEYMSEWMEYLYMQQPCPDYMEGVEVVLETLDPNGNFYEIGRTTSIASGVFACEVDLPVPGLYDIIATFEGSESYYGSYSETFLGVTEAASPSGAIEPELTEAAEASFISTEVAIVAVVAVACIIGVAAVFALRKRK